VINVPLTHTHTHTHTCTSNLKRPPKSSEPQVPRKEAGKCVCYLISVCLCLFVCAAHRQAHLEAARRHNCTVSLHSNHKQMSAHISRAKLLDYNIEYSGFLYIFLYFFYILQPSRKLRKKPSVKILQQYF